nr:MlaD family protein [Pedobacter sp. SYSU D00873]
MEATETRRKITVGIFIFIGLLIFILGVFTLGSQKKAFVKSFLVKVVFDDIQGLKAGDNVWFSGVKIGTIKKIQFYGTSQVEVTMNIEENAHQYIRKDAAASIGSDGLIGNKIIVIDGGNPRVPAIEDGDRIRVNKTLSTDEMMKTLQVNNRNLVDITSDFKTISSNLASGKGTAGALLSDEEMAKNLKSIVANLQRTTIATNKMAAELRTFSHSLNNKQGLVNNLVSDTVIFNRLRNSSYEFQQAAQSANAITSNLNTASAKLNDPNAPAGLLLNDQQTTEQLRRIIQNLESSSYNLNEDLKALQSNFLFRGYFKRKAREAEEKK